MRVSAALSGAQPCPRKITDLACHDLGLEVAATAQQMARYALGKPHDRMSQSAAVVALDVCSDERFDCVGDESRVLRSSLIEIGIASRSTAEEQLECIVVVVDPVEIREESELGPSSAVTQLELCVRHGLEKSASRLVDECEVQLPFRSEVLVENGLGDAGDLCNVVHRCLVVPMSCEDVEGDIEKLFSTCSGWQTGSHDMFTVSVDGTFR